MSFAHDVREELAHTEVGSLACRLAETSALLRLGGSLEIRGGRGVGFIVDTSAGAVARRLRTALDTVLRVSSEIEVHAPGGWRSATRYRLRLDRDVAPALVRLGILDADLRPTEGVASGLTQSAAAACAYVRGALMAAGTISDPRRDPHLEVRVSGPGVAAELAGLLQRCGAPGARAGQHRGWRVTCKSAAAIGMVLARTGAHTAFLRWDGERLRRELRAGANRAANADRANLSRAVVASSEQVVMVEWAMRSPAWADLPEELRAIGLARLANPEASLSELGSLLDPPVAKSTVHRRFAALATRAAELEVPPRWVE